MERECNEYGVPGEDAGPRDGVEHPACVVKAGCAGVEGDELGGKEVGRRN